jgi:hypothetical protein
MDAANIVLASLLLGVSCYLLAHVKATKKRHQLLIAKEGGWSEIQSGLTKDALNCFHKQSKLLVASLMFFALLDTGLKYTGTYLF